MSSFLSSLQPSPRSRPISCGGLGGLVRPEMMESSGEPCFVATWPRRKKRRPPPLTIFYDNEMLHVPSLPRSAMSPEDTISPWSPRTPSGFALDTPRYLVAGETHNLLSPATVDCCCQDPQKVLSSLPAARSCPKYSSLPQPVELAGSLLLPSQGFPPPPATPPRPLKHLLHETATSDPPSASPVHSPSLNNTADEINEMAHFLSLLKRGKPPSKLGGTSPYTEDVNAGTKLAISAPILRGTTAPKPISAMTATELFDAVDAYESNIMVEQLMAALRKNVSMLYGTAVEEGSMSYTVPDTELKEVTAELKNLFEDAGELSKTYGSLSDSLEKSVREFGEHTALERETQLEEMMNRAEMVESKASNLEQALFVKDGEIDDFKHTLSYTVGTLIDFIRSRIPTWNDNLDDHDTQDVMLIINEHSELNTAPNSTRYVRIPAASYASTLASLHKIKQQNLEHRGFALEQGSLINDLNVQADKYAVKLESAVELVKAKDYELMLMNDEKDAAVAKLRELELAATNQTVARDVAHHKQLERWSAVREAENEYEKDVAALDAQLDARNVVIGELRAQLGERQIEIESLRAQLGVAREEVFAQRAEVKNLLTEKQELLTPSKQTAEPAKGRISKALSLLGKEKETLKNFLLPTSASLADLGFRPVEPDLITLSPDPRGSTKEVVSTDRRHGVQTSASSITLRTEYSRHRVASDPFTDAASPFKTGRYGDNLQFSSAANSGSPSATTHRAMKSRLASSSRTSLLHAAAPAPESQPAQFGAGVIEPESPSIHIRQNRTPAGTKRVLSGIPEQTCNETSEANEAGDTGSDRASSATSSDRAVYQDNVTALSLLEHTRNVGSETPAGPNVAARLSLGSDISAGPTVAQLYHNATKQT